MTWGGRLPRHARGPAGVRHGQPLELPAWSAVHGLALLLVEGPLRGTPLAQARRQARAVCDVVLAGIRP